MADIQGNAQSIEGAIAHDSPVAENPLLHGGEARTTLPTAVANGDAVRSMFDDHGRMVVAPHSPRDLVVHNRITLTSTSETTLLAAVASTFLDLVFVMISSEAGTEVRIDIRDSTGGTIRLSVDAAPDGGGAVVALPVPIPQATVNNNWTAQLSAAVSTVYITAIAVKND